MTQNDGTPLYIQVEEALKEFQSGVARLKAQQTQTENLLAEGTQALENLVQQIARIDEMKEQVESDLRLLERFRESAAQEIAELHRRILADFNEHQEQTRRSLDNLKTDFSVRRQEILGLIRDLRQDFRNLELSSSSGNNELSRLAAQQLSTDKLVAGIENSMHTCIANQEDVTWRIQRLEKRNKLLVAGTIVLALGFMLSMFLH